MICYTKLLHVILTFALYVCIYTQYSFDFVHMLTLEKWDLEYGHIVEKWLSIQGSVATHSGNELL